MVYMEYTFFKDSVIEHLKEKVSKGKEVNVKKILKNNDLELDALTIDDDSSNLVPTLYLNYLYEEYENGATIDEIVEEVLFISTTYSKNKNIDYEALEDYDRARKHLACKLINSEKNRKLLLNMPYKSFLDLAIVVYYLLEENDGDFSTVMINYDCLKKWGISEEKLIEEAMENTKNLLGEYVSPLSSVLWDMYNQRPGDCLLEDEMMELMVKEEQMPMFVVSNKPRVNGAVNMLNLRFMKKLADAVDSDLYIIPSTVHEIILVPAKPDVSREELDQIIHTINKEEIKPQDVLSDHSYFYRRDLNKITL